MLDRKAILGFKDDRIEPIEVPELGGRVCIARLSAAEADKISKLPEDCPASVGIAILGLCDEAGERLFTEKDRDALGKLPATAMTKIANAILNLSGRGPDAADEAKNG